jgi:hypothetical protein
MLRRTGLPVLIFLLCLSVVATPVIAAGPPGHSSRPVEHTSGFLGVLWHALTNLIAPPDGLTAAASTCRGESGSIMDPNGCPGAGNQAGARTDRGSIMEPNG